MAKDPTYPMYAQDFDMDTSSWDVCEIGIFTRLLNACWINNGLPTDLDRMCRIARVPSDQFMKAWESVIHEKFYEEDGKFFNKRQEEVRAYRNKQKENGDKGGRPKKAKKNPKETQPITQTKPNTKPNQNLSKKEIEIETEIEEGIEIKGVVGGIELPFDSESFKQQWETWKKYKKEEFKFEYKGEESEQAALTELRNKSSGNEETAIKIINRSMGNGWKGFFELNDNNNGNFKGNNGKQTTARQAPVRKKATGF